MEYNVLNWNVIVSGARAVAARLSPRRPDGCGRGGGGGRERGGADFPAGEEEEAGAMKSTASLSHASVPIYVMYQTHRARPPPLQTRRLLKSGSFCSMFSSEGDSGDIFGPTGELLQLIDDDDDDHRREKVSKSTMRTSSSSGDSNPNELVSSTTGGGGNSTKSFDPLSEYSEFAMDNDCRSDISDLASSSRVICITHNLF